jgi:acylpyruvate hydrolase
MWRGCAAVGALTDGCVVDLGRACRAAVRSSGIIDEVAAGDRRILADLVGLLRGGEKAMAWARHAPQWVLEKRAWEDVTEWRHPLGEVQILAPVQRPGKIVCVGLNYRSHLEEIGEPIPEYPILFLKPATAILGPGQPIVLPRVSAQVDYEGEFAVVIGLGGKYIPRERALEHVAGYTCANDVSAHDIEFRTSQWTSGKMLDTFCPIGPVLLTPDEVRNPNTLRLKTRLNGEVVQDATTADMVFPVDFLISYVSSLATLEPGDVILTGTPAGIGCNRKPQVFLKPGDHVSVEIDGIGALTNSVSADEG